MGLERSSVSPELVPAGTDRVLQILCKKNTIAWVSTYMIQKISGSIYYVPRVVAFPNCFFGIWCWVFVDLWGILLLFCWCCCCCVGGWGCFVLLCVCVCLFVPSTCPACSGHGVFLQWTCCVLAVPIHAIWSVPGHRAKQQGSLRSHSSASSSPALQLWLD